MENTKNSIKVAASAKVGHQYFHQSTENINNHKQVKKKCSDRSIDL